MYLHPDNNMRFQLRTGERLALIEELFKLSTLAEDGGSGQCEESTARYTSDAAMRTAT